MTEQELMLAGTLYNAGNEALTAARRRAQTLCWRYNQTAPDQLSEREAILRELLGHMGKDCWIEPTFRCDYGTQITLGDYFYANYDCIFLDVAPITIGSRVLMGPRVGLYTAGHPTAPEVRNLGLEFGHPITIGDDVWIGGNAVLCPGVTVESGSIIAAGAVVTRDIPSGVIAGGNPCRVLRPINDTDHLKWQTALREYQQSRNMG